MAPSLLSLSPPLIVFVLGLVIGSFLNVVIARVPAGLSIVHPRSRCPRCGAGLAWYDNVPVLSWLLLRGRCRACKEPISWRYPAVELLTALLFLACLQRFGWEIELASALLLVSILVPLTFIDLEHWLLPHVITWPGIAAGVGMAATMGLTRLRDAAIGAVAGFVAFWALEWVGRMIFKREALGGGDKFLLALLGAFLTWRPLLGIIFLSSVQGAIVGSALLLVRGRAGPAPPLDEAGGGAPTPAAGVDDEDDWVPGPTNIPFGPWLCLAALELMLLGPWLAEHLPQSLARLPLGLPE